MDHQFVDSHSSLLRSEPVIKNELSFDQHLIGRYKSNMNSFFLKIYMLLECCQNCWPQNENDQKHINISELFKEQMRDTFTNNRILTGIVMFICKHRSNKQILLLGYWSIFVQVAVCTYTIYLFWLTFNNAKFIPAIIIPVGEGHSNNNVEIGEIYPTNGYVALLFDEQHLNQFVLVLSMIMVICCLCYFINSFASRKKRTRLLFGMFVSASNGLDLMIADYLTICACSGLNVAYKLAILDEIAICIMNHIKANGDYGHSTLRYFKVRKRMRNITERKFLYEFHQSAVRGKVKTSSIYKKMIDSGSIILNYSPPNDIKFKEITNLLERVNPARKFTIVSTRLLELLIYMILINSIFLGSLFMVYVGYKCNQTYQADIIYYHNKDNSGDFKQSHRLLKIVIRQLSIICQSILLILWFFIGYMRLLYFTFYLPYILLVQRQLDLMQLAHEIISTKTQIKYSKRNQQRSLFIENHEYLSILDTEFNYNCIRLPSLQALNDISKAPVISESFRQTQLGHLSRDDPSNPYPLYVSDQDFDSQQRQYFYNSENHLIAEANTSHSYYMKQYLDRSENTDTIYILKEHIDKDDLCISNHGPWNIVLIDIAYIYNHILEHVNSFGRFQNFNSFIAGTWVCLNCTVVTIQFLRGLSYFYHSPASVMSCGLVLSIYMMCLIVLEKSARLNHSIECLGNVWFSTLASFIERNLLTSSTVAAIQDDVLRLYSKKGPIIFLHASLYKLDYSTLLLVSFDGN